MTSKFSVGDLVVKGKPVKKSFQNAFTKAQATKIWVDRGAGVGKNPMTGVSVQLNPLEMSIYMWILVWYRCYEAGQMLTPISVFDNMRYLFSELNTEAYYDLVD